MPRARKQLISLADTPYYHVTSRCVRRAFLCGEDKLTGQSYEHRRSWIETRIRVLSTLFTIDICAYAVMSNHYHLVVKLNPNLAKEWSDHEVLKRWCALFKGPILIQRYLASEALGEMEMDSVRSILSVYRQRLTSLSWFMKCLNEPIARKANAEDHCTGHFWESRFSSQALVTEQALFTCMAYVDLNPVRAGLAATAECSAYTSIRERISPSADLRSIIRQLLKSGELNTFDFDIRPLLSLSPVSQDKPTNALPMRFTDYLSLVDMSGRICRRGKQQAINPEVDSILKRLELSSSQWLRASTNFEQDYWNGSVRTLKSA